MSCKKVISFDIDGVIAGGRYTPEWDRTPEHYLGLPLMSERIPEVLGKAAASWNIYLVSTRRYEDALSSTIEWLRKKGIKESLAGVITNVPRLMKGPVVEILQAEMHVDDDLAVVKQIHGGRGVLFYSPEWKHRLEDLMEVQLVNDWNAVEQILNGEPMGMSKLRHPEPWPWQMGLLEINTGGK